MTIEWMRPVAEGLFTADPTPCLIAGRHRDDGRLVFPRPAGSEAALFEPVYLSRVGILWSYTIQRFRPKSPPYAGPETFEPYAVGYVELPGEVIVESRLCDVELDGLSIGAAVELTLVPFATDPDGTHVMTYAFRPVRT